MIERTTPTLKWFVITRNTGEEINIKLSPGQVIAAPDTTTSAEHEPRIAEVLTPWMGDKQQLELDHSPFIIEDSAGQTPIPDPNMGMAYIECGADTLTAINADDTYQTMWSEAE